MFNCVEVRVDPAGDCDPEESRDVLQRADRAADLRVQEQVNVYTLHVRHVRVARRSLSPRVFLSVVAG